MITSDPKRRDCEQIEDYWESWQTLAGIFAMSSWVWVWGGETNSHAAGPWFISKTLCVCVWLLSQITSQI